MHARSASVMMGLLIASLDRVSLHSVLTLYEVNVVSHVMVSLLPA